MGGKHKSLWSIHRNHPLWRKYVQHIARCKGRIDKLGNPIEMRMTFEEFVKIWEDSGFLKDDGTKDRTYVMARHGDAGHYEIGNVTIKTQTENLQEKEKEDL